MNLLKVKNLSKTYYTKKYEIKALEDISFSLNENEFIAIVGPSGCGKSTILSIISNIEEKTSGEVLNNNNKIGYMFQQDALLEWKTVYENAILGLELQNKLTKDSIEYVKKLLSNYGLGDFIMSYPKELSGGMRQRLSLIRTLATKPDIILLDEPFSALDYQTRILISDDVYNILKNEGKSAIIVTHDIAEAISMADRIIILSKRPAKVKKIVEIDMDDKKTPIDNRKCKKFNEYYDLIWKEIDSYEK